MSRCSSRKGTPNRQFCDYIEHGIGRSTRKSQSGHATSDSVADLLGTISEEHAEKSTGSDTEEPSSTQNRDEQQQSRGRGDSQQSTTVPYSAHGTDNGDCIQDILRTGINAACERRGASEADIILDRKTIRALLKLCDLSIQAIEDNSPQSTCLH